MATKKSTKVLVVDDDPTISEIIQKKLTVSGFEVSATLNPSEAQFVATQEKPDVIILDLMMTRQSGEDIIKQLKDNEETAKAAILVFSNKGTEVDMSDEITALGADKYLVKADTSLEELVEVVEKLAK